MYSLCLLEITCQVIRWFLFSIECMALRSSRCIQACSWSEILISAGDLALSYCWLTITVTKRYDHAQETTTMEIAINPRRNQALKSKQNQFRQRVKIQRVRQHDSQMA